MSYESVREQLVAVNEELDTLIYEQLRQAVEAGESKRPERERRLSRARTAVGRAIAALEEVSDDV